MFWKLSSLPELQHLTDTERRDLLRVCAGRGFEIKLMFRCVMLAMFITGFGFIAVGLLVYGLLEIRSTSIDYALTVIFLGAWPMLTVVIYQFYWVRLRGQIRIYLHEQRQQGEQLPVCLKCGYAVEDSADRCPECGAAL